MPITLAQTHLHTLELNIEDVRLLDEEEQIRQIKKAWKKLCLKTHPDKTGGSSEKYLQVNDAYTALLSKKPNVGGGYTINNYFHAEHIGIPLSAFDIPMQEGIFLAFEQLKNKILDYSSEEAKKRFVAHYKDFFNLALELEQRQEELTRVRAQAYYDHQQNTSLIKILKLEWNRLMISLFGEEYLDDFQYRHALAFGHLRPILATRKLISPLKWLAALVGSLNLLFQETAKYAISHWQTAGADLANILAILGSPFYAANLFMSILACPINNLIRPLVAKTSIPAPVFIALFSTAAAGIIYGCIVGALAISFASITLFLPYLNVALNLYAIYQTIQLVRNNGLSKTDGFFLSLISVINALPSMNPIIDIIFSVASLSFILLLKRITDERPIEHLPLPKEEIPEKIKKATLLGYTKANQSHLFFGTPKDADFQNERSPWQKTTSFFGMDNCGYKKPAASPDFNTEANLGLSYA